MNPKDQRGGKCGPVLPTIVLRSTNTLTVDATCANTVGKCQMLAGGPNTT